MPNSHRAAHIRHGRKFVQFEIIKARANPLTALAESARKGMDFTGRIDNHEYPPVTAGKRVACLRELRAEFTPVSGIAPKAAEGGSDLCRRIAGAFRLPQFVVFQRPREWRPAMPPNMSALDRLVAEHGFQFARGFFVTTVAP